jgi:hypothetical protein
MYCVSPSLPQFQNPVGVIPPELHHWSGTFFLENYGHSLLYRMQWSFCIDVQVNGKGCSNLYLLMSADSQRVNYHLFLILPFVSNRLKINNEPQQPQVGFNSFLEISKASAAS